MPFDGSADDESTHSLGGLPPDWAALFGSVTVRNHTALLSGTSWVAPETVKTFARPTFISYSFPITVPSQTKEAYPDGVSTWAAFNASERGVARAALKAWGDACGITFIEVKGGKGDILFNWMAFEPIGEADAGAFAYYPIGFNPFRVNNLSEFEPYSGDIYVKAENRKSLAADKGEFTHVLLHEIGHALGLKHPFGIRLSNNRVLAEDLDNTKQTVMSYVGSSPVLGPLDKAAIRALYGDPTTDGSNVAFWKWNAVSQTLSQVGKSGTDFIYGISVRDVIKGGGGHDRIWGFAGNDTITGGSGSDVISGGAGRDTFVFNATLSRTKNVDRVSDFSASEDKIRLENLVFEALTRKGALAPDHFHEGTAAADADDHVLYNSSTGTLAYDPDGNGSAAPTPFAILKNLPSLTAANFIVI